MDNDKACQGADTIEVYKPGAPMAECRSCETRIRWDLVEHPFWGFQNCEHATKPE